MTIRFAAAVNPAQSARLGMHTPAPANDNPVAGARIPRAALLHFAEHGLSAAAAARANAEQAFFVGDRAAYRHWLGICRTFDRRLAMALNGLAGGTSG